MDSRQYLKSLHNDEKTRQLFKTLKSIMDSFPVKRSKNYVKIMKNVFLCNVSIQNSDVLIYLINLP